MIFFNTIKRIFKKIRRIFSLSFEKKSSHQETKANWPGEF